MAKPARGLPDGFNLSLPDEPVQIGDFLDEEPPPITVKRPLPRVVPETKTEPFVPSEEISSRALRREVGERPVLHGTRKIQQPVANRCQLNLTPKSRVMLEEIVEHVRSYGPQHDAKVSEVFQAVLQLLHGAMADLEVSELPKRGAWGSVTAKNFPVALSEAFERAIVKSARGGSSH